MLSYIARHWQGKLSVSRSFFLNLIAAYFLTVILLFTLRSHFSAVSGLALFAVIQTWGIVGTLRSATRVIKESPRRLDKILSAIVLLAVALIVTWAMVDIWHFFGNAAVSR
jgi:hypothetical protein